MRYQVGHFVIESAARRIFRAGTEVRLGGRAYDLLMALLERRERVVGHDELYELVWSDLAVEPNNLPFQVWALRRLLGAGAIVTVPRRGYQFAAPVAELPDTRPGPPTLAAQSLPAGSLAQAVREHRLVTLVAADDSLRLAAVQAACKTLAAAFGGGLWHPPRRLLLNAEGLRALVQRLAHQDALLVLEDGPEHRAATHQAVACALALSSTLHVLVSSDHALGLGGEHAMVAPATWAPAPHLPAPSAPTRLRWRPRHVVLG